MSKSIDERIVEMQFNNQQFESGIKESLGSLDRLKKGLDLEGASRSLTGLGEVGRKFSLAGIAEGVDTIAGKFTTLGIIGVTAIENIANSAVNFGKKIVSALTIDPITTGFNEYELKMGSIQTIMAGTGAGLEEVNKKLNELNTYSDKTIYSFSDMTQNIGKFTNAGVSLNGSVAAIQGVANVAAVSGANANEASRAMYNFAQAISSGYVKLIDWKSIELANMGTVEFKQQLIDAAVAAGTLADAGNGLFKTYKGTLVSATQGFNDSLQDQWMTTEVLVKTLGDYADETTEIGKKAFAAATEVKTLTQMYDTLKESAQSGWAQSWEIISGDFNEGKTLYTELGNAIGGILQKSADARNAILQFWKDNGGRTALIESFKNVFGALNQVIAPIREAFKDFFPPMTGERLLAITDTLKTFTERLKMGEDTINNLHRTFSGFFAILSIGKQAISAIAGGIARLFKILAPGADGFLGFTAGIGDWLVSLDAAIKKGDTFNKVVQGIGNVVEWVADKVGKGVTAIMDFFGGFGNVDLSGVESFTDRIKIRFEPFSALFEGIGKVFSNTVEILKKVAPLFYKLAGAIGKGLMSLQEKILGAIENGDFSSVLDVINTGLFGALILGIKKFVNSMSDVTGGFSGILDGVKGSLEAWQTSLKSGTLLKIAISIGILAASLAVLAAIDSAKLTAALVAITTLFAELFGSMAIFSKIMEGSGFKGIMKITTAMMGISIAILILSAAMTKIAQLDWAGITKGLISIGALMGMLVATTKLLSNTSGMIKGASGFILFAVAINVLASAVKKLGEIDIVSLGKGLVSVGVMMTELALFMKTTDVNKMGITKGIGILLLATAMTVLASAVKKLGEIDLGSLAKGLGSMGIILVELALFINATPDAKRVISTATGLVILGAAMLIFASAIEKMGGMPIGEIVKGLVAMAGALGIVTLALNFMPKNMVLTGVGLVAVATALVILAQALQTMGGMSWEGITKGLVTLAGSLTIIAIAMSFMTTALPGAAALLVVATALAILATVLEKLGSMSLAEIGKGLLALAGIFVVIGLAGLILAPITPIILALGIAVALLGVGCLAVGAGLLAFSAGLTALAVAGSAGAAALVVVVTSIIGLIPFIFQKLGEGLIALAVVIGDGAPVLVMAIGKLMIAILDKVIELTPKIVEAAIVVITGFLQAVIETTPKVIEAIFTLLTSLLDAIVEFIPKLVDAGMKIIIGFLKGIADNIGEVISTAIDIVANFLMAIGRETPRVVDAGFKMMIDFINGLADSIRKNIPLLNQAIANLIDAMLGGFINTASSFVDIGKNIINGLISGIKAMATRVVDAAKGVVDGAIEGAKKLLGIHSPSTVFTEIGMYADKGFANGLSKFSGLVRLASKDVGNTAVKSLSGAISNMANIVNGDLDMSPTIRPVLDLSNIKTGMNSIFNGNRTISANVRANDLAESIVTNRPGQTTSIGGSQKTSKEVVSIENSFSGAIFNVREEADIRKIARELYQLQLAGSRG